jgi:branched-chain amino acid transport system substrate-binding protein
MRRSLFSALRVSAVVLAACSAAPAFCQEYTVAAELALTGTYAWVGVPSHEGLLVGLDEVNASGMLGAAKIKLTVEDTGSEKAQAITLMNRFAARDNVLMVLGPSSSSEGVAIAPVANDLKVPLLTTTAVSDAINKSGIWAFKTPSSPSVIIGEVAKYAVDNLRIKSAALVWGRDNDGQVGQKNAALAYFKAHNVDIVAEESVLTTDTDFLALLTKITAKNPDALFLALTAEQAASFIIQARQGGIDPKVRFIGVPNMGAEQFITIGGKAVEGSTFVADYFPNAQSAENQRFVAEYKKRYNRLPDNGAALGYTAIKLAASAIKAAGAQPTREKVRAALAKIKALKVILGRGDFSYDENRGALYGAVILAIKNGKIVPAPSAY